MTSLASKSMIPEKLKEIEKRLQDANIQIESESGDGRMDSAIAEQEIVRVIRDLKICQVHSPNEERGNNRAWHDVRIDEYYCDIKISECKTNDNTNAKAAIYYFLTGDSNPEKISPRDSVFFKKMKKNEKADERRDYYYLVVNKNEPSDVFFVSLKGLRECIPAPNNPPFQVNWGNCRCPVNRNWEQSRKFLLGQWAKSIKQLIQLRENGMPRAYPEFFDKN